jgi:hypothetical protein
LSCHALLAEANTRSLPCYFTALLSSQGTSTSSGGDYTLGGVWSGSPEKLPRAHLPLLVR